MSILNKSAEPRDVENEGSRFWLTDPNGVEPFGSQTVGVVDEAQGGVIAYTHEDNANALLMCLRHYTGEV